MGNTSWKINEMATQIGSSIENVESNVIKLQDELESMHLFLDSLQIPRWGMTKHGYHGPMSLGERLILFRENDARYEKVDSPANI